MSMQKTKFYKTEETNTEWVLVDARGKILGRLATRIAQMLQGKDKARWSPNFITGNKVVVINAKYVHLTGMKQKTKFYDKYSGYPSGRKEISLEELMQKNPVKVVYYAVKGMLPKNKLAKLMLRNLKIYPESGHRNAAQKPREVKL